MRYLRTIGGILLVFLGFLAIFYTVRPWFLENFWHVSPEKILDPIGERGKDPLYFEDMQRDTPREESLSFGNYAIFSLNIHDWTHPEESLATVARAVALHEEYEVPLALYMTDPMFRLLEVERPDLLEDIKKSAFVTVAYHLRPPSPYYLDFDWYGLDDLSDKDLYDLIMAYETHALDLETGEYLPNTPGGYAHMKDVLGYAPLSVGTLASGRVGEMAAKVYRDLGAIFAVRHGGVSSLGDKDRSGFLWYRPEDVDVKIYESARTSSAEAVLEGALAKDPKKAYVLGIKYHENDFYLRGTTPWYEVYYEGTEKERRAGEEVVLRTPPFAMDQQHVTSILQSTQEQEKDWKIYEDALRYVGKGDRITPLGLDDLPEYLSR